jgi:hypothetical protein
LTQRLLEMCVQVKVMVTLQVRMLLMVRHRKGILHPCPLTHRSDATRERGQPMILPRKRRRLWKITTRNDWFKHISWRLRVVLQLLLLLI